ncbi:hypothetical protein M8J77_012418 [Diaphorina citri]|nr:hypothetical protein M8J77_012418 [Diaphorina citri]
MKVERFWMDNVWCSGYETAISTCRFDGWGQHDCGPTEVAGVICAPTERSQVNPGDKLHSGVSNVKKQRRVRIGDHFGHFKFRLVGGRTPNEGRVQIKLNQGDFGHICGDGWSILEASLVCKTLNLGYATAAPTHHSSGNTVLYHVKCAANHTSWQQCTTLLHSNLCPDHRVAGVVCTRELPDLEIDFKEIEDTLHIQDRQLYYLQCAMEENCLADEAYRLRNENPDGSWYLKTRRLLRFTAKTTNIGNIAFRPFIPKYLWKYHQCHQHYHSMEVFATFDILDQSGAKVAQGHKASFCLEDNECARSSGRQYACANFGDQGVSPNCSDIYRFNIDCQWIDISELASGLYTFKVSINPEYKVPEQRYDNNAVTCTLYYVQTYVKLYNCKLGSP